MAFALVYWTQDKQYSVVCSKNIHGDAKEGETFMVDWEESRKGKKPAKITTYPAKIIKVGDNEEERELECIKIAEEMEDKVTSRKRPRKKSRIALESDEPMDFLSETQKDMRLNNEEKAQKQQQQQEKGNQKEKRPKKKTHDASSQQKGNKREAMKNKKTAEIEAGKNQAAIFFKERYMAVSTSTYTLSTHTPILPTHTSTVPTHTPILPTHTPILPTHTPTVPTHTPILPTPVPSASTSLVETGSFLRSLYDLDADEDMSTSETLNEIEQPLPPGRDIPCENCLELVTSLKEEIAALKKRQLPFPISPENVKFLEDILKVYKGDDFAKAYQGPSESVAISSNSPSAQRNEKPADINQECSSTSGPGKQELVPGSGVYISSVRLHSIHSQSGKDPKKLFLLLIETFFSNDTLATSLAHGSRKLKSKDGSVMTALNQDIVKTVKAYAGRFATINNTDLSVAKMNRILTNKVGTAKRKKLRDFDELRD